MSAAADHQIYIQTKVNPILEQLVTQLLMDRPEDPAAFMLNWLRANSSAGADGNAESVAELEAEVARLQAKKAELEAKS